MTSKTWQCTLVRNRAETSTHCVVPFQQPKAGARSSNECGRCSILHHPSESTAKAMIIKTSHCNKKKNEKGKHQHHQSYWYYGGCRLVKGAIFQSYPYPISSWTAKAKEQHSFLSTAFPKHTYTGINQCNISFQFLHLRPDALFFPLRFFPPSFLNKVSSI